MTSAQRVREIEEIDRQAFGLAQRVAGDPTLRPELAARASTLKARLLEHAGALRTESPGAAGRVQHQVSESLLDLNHVIEDTGCLSLRLGDLLR